MFKAMRISAASNQQTTLNKVSSHIATRCDNPYARKGDAIRRQAIYRLSKAGATYAVAACVLLLTAGSVIAGNASIESLHVVVRPAIWKTKSLPPHFLGLSIEYSQVRYLTGAKNGNRRLFSQMMNNLAAFIGPPVLRIGGNSEDVSIWNLPAVSPKPSKATFNITPRFIHDLGAVQQRTHCPLILGLNLACNRPALAAQWVRAAENGFPKGSIMAFEIGNEPDGYASWDHYRPGNWSFADYIRNFNRYVSAIHATDGWNIPLAGPAMCCGWLKSIDASRFISLEHQNLAVATYHYYPLEIKSKDKASAMYPSIRHLLQPSSSTLFSTLLQPVIKLARPYRIPVRWGEANSCNGGGKAGVSNTMASALWGLDTLFETASAGAAGINFHMAGCYAPFSFHHRRVAVAPLYYALWIFAQAMQKEGHLISVFQHGVADDLVNIWAAQDDHRTVRVVLINKHVRRAVAVHLRLLASRNGKLQVFSAPGISSENHLRFGGVTFDDTTDGRPVGYPTSKLLTSHNHIFTIILQPASAALLTCR